MTANHQQILGYNNEILYDDYVDANKRNNN